MFCGRAFDHHAFNPFFAESLMFDPLRMGAMGGAPGWCRKVKAHCQERNLESNILIDVTETEDSIQIVAEVPGATKDTVQIEIENAVLAISVAPPDEPTPVDTGAPPRPPANEVDPADVAGPSSAPPPPSQQGSPAADPAEVGAEGTPDEGSQRRVLLQERPTKFAKRIVELPEGAEALKAEASCSDGVLTITIPRQPAPESKTRVPVS